MLKNLNLNMLMILRYPHDEGGEGEEEEELPGADEIKDLKENFVSKEKYEKLQEEYKKVVKVALEGDEEDEGSSEASVEPAPDIKVLRDKLFNEDNNLSNLEFAETTLALRKAIIDKGGTDPFLPTGHTKEGTLYAVTEQDKKDAQNVADIFQHCIDYAEGDNEAFTAELMRLTKDVAPMVGKARVGR